MEIPPGDARRFWIERRTFGASERAFHWHCLWDSCALQFGDVDLLISHLRNHVEQRRHDPAFCPISRCHFDEFVEEGSVDRHVLVHIHQVKLMAKGIKSILKKSQDRSHFECKFSTNAKLFFDGRPMTCEWHHCLTEFTDIEEYVAHLERHVKETCFDEIKKGFMCGWNQCDVVRGRKSVLSEHARTHVGGKTIACPMCGSLFASERILHQHLARSDRDNASLGCSHCHKFFATDELLKAHLRRHLKANPCTTCSAIFDSPAALKRHVLTVHHEFRLFRCDICKTSHGSASDLERHKTAVHCAKPSIFCPKCNASFRWRKQLIAHERTHTQNAISDSYACHLCESRYKTGFSLSRHLKSTHRISIPTGFSRYQYKLCSDGFKRLATKVFVKQSCTSSFTENQLACGNVVDGCLVIGVLSLRMSDPKSCLSRAIGCLYGQLIGDALGARYEFKSSIQVAQLITADRDKSGFLPILGGGPFHMKPGQVTDDSEMALSLATSLVALRKFSAPEIATSYVAWLQSNPPDRGITTEVALTIWDIAVGPDFRAKISELEMAKIHAEVENNVKTRNEHSLSNGALMRISPLAIATSGWENVENIRKCVHADVELTHWHELVKETVFAYVLAIRALIRGESAEGAFNTALGVVHSPWAKQCLIDARESAVPVKLLDGSEIQGDTQKIGFIGIALQSAFHELLHAPTFAEGVERAILRGGDTDTNGCITAALLGARFGNENIPEEWKKFVRHAQPRDPSLKALSTADVEELAQKLMESVLE